MRRDRPSFPGLFVFVALLSPAASAWAQPPPEAPATPPAAKEEGAAPVAPKTADEYALEGRTLAMQPGRLLDARAALLTAWSMKQSFDTAGNLGSVELELGMMRDAAEHLLYCAQNFPSVRDQAQNEKLARVEGLLAKAREHVGSLRIRVTDSDGIELTGAEVLVDGKAIGRTPLPDEVFVEPGARVISARQPGFLQAEKRVEAAKGAAASVALQLAGSKDPSRVAKGGGPEPGSKKSVGLIVAGAGAAAVGIGLGVGFHLASNGKSGDAQAAWDELRGSQNDRGACLNPGNAARCDELRSAHDSKELFRGLAIGGYVAGGALAVGTLVYALMPGQPAPGSPDRQGSTPRVRAFVGVAPGGGGAVLEGRF